MILKNLKLLNFRNYKSLEISFSSGINFITGNNGAGKTNILEAISIISNLKSFRNINDNSIVMWDTDSYYCSGSIEESEYKKFEVGYTTANSKSKKKFKIDGSEITRGSDYYGKLITVSFIPTDINIINGSPEIRRKYFDSVISKISPDYINELNRYKDIIQSRNLIIKKIRDKGGESRLLDIWNTLYAEKAELIIGKRNEFISKFNNYFRKNYLTISGEKYSPEIVYSSTFKNRNYNSIHEEIKKNVNYDIRRGSTTAGPHRDDYIIKTGNNMLFTEFSSQGQKRTSSISLKLSEAEIIREMKGKSSIILVDDIFSELDEKRRDSMIELLKDRGQIIFTMVNHFYDKKIFHNSKHYFIENGIVNEGIKV